MLSSNNYYVPLVFKQVIDMSFTGEVVLKDDTYTKNLYFKSGELVNAKSDIFDEKLGVILFLLGKITEEEYENIGGLAHSVDDQIGDILIQNNFISNEDLMYAKAYQVKKIAVDSFLFDKISYEIIEKEPVIFSKKLSVPSFQIVVEGVRKMKDLSFFKEKVQFLSPETLNISKTMQDVLNQEELELHDNIKKLKGKSNQEIISSLTLNPNDYWAAMLIFVLMKVVDFRKSSSDYDIVERTQALIRLNKAIEDGKVDNYKIFEIKKSASVKEIHLAYEKISKKFNSKCFGSSLAPEIKDIADLVSIRLKQIREELLILCPKHNEEKLKIKNTVKIELPKEPVIEKKIIHDKEDEVKKNVLKETKVKEDKVKEDKIKENVIEEDEDPFHLVKKHINRGSYQDAIDVLKRELRGTQLRGEYFNLLGLAQLHNDFKSFEVEMNLKKAIELNPGNAEPIFNLGELYNKLNKKVLAARCYEKVIKMTKDNQKAVVALRELHKKNIKKQSIFSILSKDIKF